MNITRFVSRENLQPADVIKVKKSGGLGLLGHYIVYMGKDHYGNPLFMAAMRGGVRWVSVMELQSRSHEFDVRDIRRFNGSWRDRSKALQRAKSLLGKTYDLLTSNCEHFANYVQEGEYRSSQSQTAGVLAGLGVLALILGGLGGASNSDRR